MALWFSRCLKNILEYTGFVIDFKTRPCHVEVRGSREEELLFQFLFLIQHSCHIGSKVESRVQIFMPGQLWSWEQKKLRSCSVPTSPSHNHSPRMVWASDQSSQDSFKRRRESAKSQKRLPAILKRGERGCLPKWEAGWRTMSLLSAALTLYFRCKAEIPCWVWWWTSL